MTGKALGFLGAICGAAWLWPTCLAAAEIPLRSAEGLYIVTAEINRSVRLDFLVDTGATVVTLPANVIEILIGNGTLTPNDVLGSGTAELADRSIYRTAGFRLREVQVGNVVARNVTAIASPGLAQPILGQSFLRQFRSVTFDNTRNLLILSDADSSDQDRNIALLTAPYDVVSDASASMRRH